MSTDDHIRNMQALNAKIKALEAENVRLIEHNEDNSLLGLIATSINALDSSDSILAYTLEQIAKAMRLPYCAYCELLQDQALPLDTYATFRDEQHLNDQISLPGLTVSDEPLIFSEDDLISQRIVFNLEGGSFQPQTLAVLPVSARQMNHGILLIADNQQSHDRLLHQIVLIERVLEIVTGRLDNLTLVQELQQLNTALNNEVDRKVGELHQTNQELLEAILQHSQAAGAMQRQHNIITNLAEASPLCITILDKNGNITFANKLAEAVLGLEKSEITGRQYDSPSWKITDFNGEPFPSEELSFAKVMNTGQPVQNIRHAIEKPDGERVLLEINAAPIFDDDYNFDGMAASIEDVTEQVNDDAEFYRLQNFNADIVQNISEGIIIQDADGILTFTNPTISKLLGYHPEEVLGKHWTVIIPQDQREIVKNADKRRRQGISDRYEVEIKKKNGGRIPILVSGSPRINPRTGDFLGTMAVFSDITEIKTAEKMLQDSEERYRGLSEATFEAIFISENGYCIEQNATAEKIFGYTSSEAVGKFGSDWIAPEDRELATQHMLSGYEKPYEATALCKDGSTFPAELQGRITYYKGKTVRVTALRDISERKRAETLNRLQRELAFQLSAVVGLDAVLQLCLKTAIKYTQMDAGGIYLTNKRTGDITLANSIGLSPEFVKAASFFTADSQNINMMHGDPVYSNFGTLNLPEDDFRMREKLVSTASLPIKFEGQILAFLNVASRSLERIPKPNIQILEAIAAQIGSAVARAQAEEQLRQRADQLKLINNIGEKIAADLDLENVLTRTARLIQEGFSYEHVSLFLIDQPNNKVVMKTISGDFKALFPPGHTLDLGEGLVGIAASKNNTTFTNDVDSSPHYVNHYPDIIHTRSELSVPIQIGGQVVGVIDAQSVKQNAFDENDIMVMETLADQVAVAIHNANLHEDVQRELIERTRIETALRESEEKFRSIVESSPMGMHMYHLDPDRGLVFIDSNRAADQLLGINNDQFIGKTIEQAFPALTQTEIPEKYRLAAAIGQFWQTEQVTYEENEISGSFEVYAFQTSPGRMVAMFLENTERKRMQVALAAAHNETKRNLAFTEALLSAIPTPVFFKDMEGRYIGCNQAFVEQIGVSNEQIRGKTVQQLWPSEFAEIYYQRDMELINKPERQIYESKVRDKDGKDRDVIFAKDAFYNETGELAGIVGAYLDISERKRAESRVQRQLQRLAALNQIDAAITGNLGLDQTIKIVLEQTVRQLEIDAAAVLRFKPLTQTLEYFALHGFRDNSTPPRSIRLGQELAGRIALERQAMQSSDADQGFPAGTRHFSDEGFRSYYGVPLITKGQVKGVLEFFDRSLLNFSEGWDNFLTTVAGQTAIAIDSAELVENLERSNLELRLAYNNTLEGWARALELRDFETQGHSQSVSELTIQLAQIMGIPNDEMVHVLRGALLHDIGKMGIPDQILLKNGPLDENELEIMRQHPVYAYEMLVPIEFLRPALDIPYYHHEKWDGSGYPHGLKGESIPLAARIFAIVDVWDALSSDRPYRVAWSEDAIFEFIRSESGKHFDPRVVDAFLEIVPHKS